MIHSFEVLKTPQTCGICWSKRRKCN